MVQEGWRVLVTEEAGDVNEDRLASLIYKDIIVVLESLGSNNTP